MIAVGRFNKRGHYRLHDASSKVQDNHIMMDYLGIKLDKINGSNSDNDYKVRSGWVFPIKFKMPSGNKYVVGDDE